MTQSFLSAGRRLAGVFAIALALVPFAYAQSAGAHRPPGRGRRGRRVLRSELDRAVANIKGQYAAAPRPVAAARRARAPGARAPDPRQAADRARDRLGHPGQRPGHRQRAGRASPQQQPHRRPAARAASRRRRRFAEFRARSARRDHDAAAAPELRAEPRVRSAKPKSTPPSPRRPTAAAVPPRQPAHRGARRRDARADRDGPEEDRRHQGADRQGRDGFRRRRGALFRQRPTRWKAATSAGAGWTKSRRASPTSSARCSPARSSARSAVRAASSW